MKTAMPRPASAASPPTSVSSSTRSISMSPESARPVTAGHVDARVPAVAQLRGPGRRRPARAGAKALTTPSTWSLGAAGRCRARATARCSAAASGRRSDWSGRASSLPVPQPARTAAERRALSSTVLPTPRSPVSTRRALRAAAGDALEHDVEGVELARRDRRARAGAGRRRGRTGSAPGPRSEAIRLSSVSGIHADTAVGRVVSRVQRPAGAQGTWGAAPPAASIGLPAACQARIPPVRFATS